MVQRFDSKCTEIPVSQKNNSKIETKNNINFNVFVLEIIPKKRRKFSL